MAAAADVPLEFTFDVFSVEACEVVACIGRRGGGVEIPCFSPAVFVVLLPLRSAAPAGEIIYDQMRIIIRVI